MNRSNDIVSAAQLPHYADCEMIQTGKCHVLLSGDHAVGRGMAPMGLHALDVAVRLPAAPIVTTAQAPYTLQHWSYLMQGLSALFIGAALHIAHFRMLTSSFDAGLDWWFFSCLAFVLSNSAIPNGTLLVYTAAGC